LDTITDAHADLGELFAFTYNCPSCGGPTELQCVEWSNEKPLEPVPLVCPYCRRVNTPELPARLAWAAKAPPPQTSNQTR
jgi:hypothetical protein